MWLMGRVGVWCSRPLSSDILSESKAALEWSLFKVSSIDRTSIYVADSTQGEFSWLMSKWDLLLSCVNLLMPCYLDLPC